MAAALVLRIHCGAACLDWTSENPRFEDGLNCWGAASVHSAYGFVDREKN